MSYTAQEYLDSIEASLEDLRAASEHGYVPISVLRDLDRQVEEIRNLWVEYLVPKGKTLVEVFAEEERGRKERS